MTSTPVRPSMLEHSPSRGRNRLAATFRLGYLLWMLSFIKDWFTSEATQYPERIFAKQAVSILVVGAILLWPATRGPKLRLLWSIIAVGAVWTLSPPLLVTFAGICTALALDVELCRPGRVAALICTIASYCALSHLSRTGFGAATLAIVVSWLCAAPDMRGRLRRDVLAPLVIAVLALFVALTFMPGTNCNVTILGLGLGLSHSHHIGTLLLEEQGVIGLVCAFAISYIALISSLILLTDVAVTREGRQSAAVTCGGLAGLMLLAHTGAPFLSVSATSGTLAFSVLVAAGILALDVRSSAELGKSITRLKFIMRFSAVALTVIAIPISLWVATVSFRAYHQVLPLRVSGSPHKWQNHWVPLAAVSTKMKDSTIAMEDSSFYRNCGIDFAAEHYALRADLRAGRPVLGGSTITQQLARNLFLNKRKTIARKATEAVYALVLGRMLTKDRILELYLNLVNYGMGRRGIYAAALGYFHRLPSQLTLAQSAVLVGIVPRPPRLSTYTTNDGEPPYPPIARLDRGRNIALSRLQATYPQRYSPDEITDARVLPITSLVYPWKDALDRGAVDVIPPVWHGVSFYSFSEPSQPIALSNVSPYLKTQLRKFVLFARKHLGLTGIDDLGVYCDRAVRGHPTILSSHAYGQAIDISGFRFANNTQLLVAQHSHKSACQKLLAIEQQLRRYFNPVVDWRSDPRWHNTHFHCEVKGPRTDDAQTGRQP